VRMDPRVKTPQADLEAQHALAQRLCAAMARVAVARQGAGQPPASDAAARLGILQRQLTQLLGEVEEADLPPTPAIRSAAEQALASLDSLLGAPEAKR
jgi:hypothetical protein